MHLECTTSPELLREIVAELLPRGHTVSPCRLDSLYERHHGNLRACLRELYDLCAQEDRLP